MRSDRALVMLSGGLDSATCLYWAKEKYSEVIAITFNYFGRLVQERRASVQLIKTAGINKLIEIDLPFVKEAADSSYYSGRLKENPHSYAQESSYVPARNMIFYSIGAHYAEYLGVKWIIGGHNLHDAKFFKDASKRFIDKINMLFKEGCLLCNDQAYQILLPLSRMNRKEIIRLAIKLKVPIELTWSCHREGTVHCGSCYACRQRLEAFDDLGLKDPVFFFVK
ncbi:MAG TPA: 7-cyano-7-deazaguanine synthase QueC [Nitrososphaera sp.]|jgi:7-cyano-7-deazaguanine synthase|nr:7-cyano-7-deazaguanine synthase QueC [Nitrososphaera sp.]